MERKELQRLILKGTDGLMGSATDLALSFIFFQTEVWEKPSMNTVVNWAPWTTQRHLESLNYQIIKRAIVQLVAKNLVKRDKSGLKITASGRERINNLFPSTGANNHRKTGEVYLVAYDVKENTRSGRVHLRRLLKRIKAISLQESLFIVTIDPQDHLEELLGAITLDGQVLITKLGRDSVMGGKSIANFLSGAYKLDKLNARYHDFIKRFSRVKNSQVTNMMLDFAFNCIIKDDPNLPKEFLPNDWLGTKAWALYNKLHTSDPIGSVVC